MPLTFREFLNRELWAQSRHHLKAWFLARFQTVLFSFNGFLKLTAALCFSGTDLVRLQCHMTDLQATNYQYLRLCRPASFYRHCTSQAMYFTGAELHFTRSALHRHCNSQALYFTGTVLHRLCISQALRFTGPELYRHCIHRKCNLAGTALYRQCLSQAMHFTGSAA